MWNVYLLSNTQAACTQCRQTLLDRIYALLSLIRKHNGRRSWSKNRVHITCMCTFHEHVYSYTWKNIRGIFLHWKTCLVFEFTYSYAELIKTVSNYDSWYMYNHVHLRLTCSKIELFSSQTLTLGTYSALLATKRKIVGPLTREKGGYNVENSARWRQFAARDVFEELVLTRPSQLGYT